MTADREDREDWVPCHRRLVSGRKKAWPRAVRFVLLELSLEARATGGVIEFPPEWTTLDAVHDLLGGDRRELSRALKLFEVRDEFEQPTIEIERDLLRHRLKITKWREHAGPRRGSERTADWRARKKNEELQESSRHTPFSAVTGVTPRGEEITKHKRTGEASAPLPPARSDGEESGYDLALRVWSEEWLTRYGDAYQLAPNMGQHGDGRVLQRIGALATASGVAPEHLLRKKLRAFFADQRPWVVENRHPLRAFEGDWNKYGVTDLAKAPSDAPPEFDLGQYRPKPKLVPK